MENGQKLKRAQPCPHKSFAIGSVAKNDLA